ncbi:PIN domain protein [Methanobrevibacter woesei]|uniref:PIN domain protein n=1 Tax=Methanobrevibacter woesei TaxID=190976 RepID=A0A2U1S7S3_9EURY|nr:PIN domain-containing protein [Methanobrevibacter woesei]PWB86114.1 PIN domain protein [Methanobrevibacter woesei]
MLFLDSSYLIALILENDNYNDKAIELNKIISNETTIIKNTVLTEVLNSFNKYNVTQIESIINDLLTLNIDYLTKNDYKKALKYYKYYNTAINFSDCILVTMNKYKTNQVISFDSDFNKIKGIINISF